MLLGKVIKNINKKYKTVKFNNIRSHSKDCKFNDVFFELSGNNLDQDYSFTFSIQ